eukprot:9285793-Karenia_brevis.AAC.1
MKNMYRSEESYSGMVKGMRQVRTKLHQVGTKYGKMGPRCGQVGASWVGANLDPNWSQAGAKLSQVEQRCAQGGPKLAQ